MNHFANQQQTRNEIQQFKGNISVMPACRTGDISYLMDGSRKDQFVGRLEKEYGMTTEEAEECIHALG